MDTKEIDIAWLNEITDKIIGAAIQVHKTLGAGFTEKIYHDALCIEFEAHNILYEKEKIIKVEYKDKLLGEQRVDLLVENEIILELKAVENIGNIHIAQLISYLKTLKKKIGLILNFAESKLAIKRVII